MICSFIIDSAVITTTIHCVRILTVRVKLAVLGLTTTEGFMEQDLRTKGMSTGVLLAPLLKGIDRDVFVDVSIAENLMLYEEFSNDSSMGDFVRAATDPLFFFLELCPFI